MVGGGSGGVQWVGWMWFCIAPIEVTWSFMSLTYYGGLLFVISSIELIIELLLWYQVVTVKWVAVITHHIYPWGKVTASASYPPPKTKDSLPLPSPRHQMINNTTLVPPG